MFIIFILRTPKFTEMWCAWFVCVTPLPLHTFATNEHLGSYTQKLSPYQQELNVLKNFCKAPLSDFIKIYSLVLHCCMEAHVIYAFVEIFIIQINCVRSITFIDTVIPFVIV